MRHVIQVSVIGYKYLLWVIDFSFRFERILKWPLNVLSVCCFQVIRGVG
jgi:hypothetical protein